MTESIVVKTAPGESVVAAASSLARPAIRTYSEEDRRRWDEFVRSEPTASFFHLSGWMRVMERTFGYRPCAVYAERDGEVTGVLPLFSIKNWILGDCLISTPFAVYGGIAARDNESQLALLEYAKQMAQERQVQYLELRNRNGEPQPGFHVNPRYVTFTGELSADPEANLKGLPKDTRYMIRKAQKGGLSVRRGLDQIRDFYGLMAMSLRRLGTPMFPLSLFTSLAEEFPGEIDLRMVYSDREAVSGVFTFTFGDTVLPYYAGASPEAPRLAANNLMYWELMQWACRQGYRRFDFGRSKKGTGAYAFKSQWNMKVSPLPYQVLLVQKKTVPDFSPVNPLFEKATRVWNRLPLWLTKHAGPHVVRWFP
ncbi:MAG TPA: FemAB family XrtA/PEP-CTERM system-associated protein [Candidatus Angelobacter sp.]